jgi:hypothetical protein
MQLYGCMLLLGSLPGANLNAFRKFALAIRRSQQPVPSRAGLRAPENVPPSALFFGSSVGLARVRA